jgi:NitT/TauT family transport system permease protein
MTLRRLAAAVIPPLVPLVFVLATVELATAQHWVPAFLVPRPSAALTSLVDDRVEIWNCFVDTAEASLAGFAISTIVGVTIAVILATGGWVRRTFYPYAVIFQTVPIIAIAPLLVIWFGFDIKAVIASAFIVSVFPVIASALNGLLSVDPALIDLFRLYGASRTATLFKLRLPYAMPNILTGLRISSGAAVIGAIVGEFITGGGLGGLIQVARQQRQINKVFATLLVASLFGMALFGLINLLSRLLLRHWHASEKT